MLAKAPFAVFGDQAAEDLVGCQNSAIVFHQGFHAARLYSLMRQHGRDFIVGFRQHGTQFLPTLAPLARQ